MGRFISGKKSVDSTDHHAAHTIHDDNSTSKRKDNKNVCYMTPCMMRLVNCPVIRP